MANDRLADSIRRVLLQEWDPIGISDVARAQDEYDPYVPEILRSLGAGTNPQSIAAFLVAIETERMGLVADKRRAQRVAQSLLGLR